MSLILPSRTEFTDIFEQFAEKYFPEHSHGWTNRFGKEVYQIKIDFKTIVFLKVQQDKDRNKSIVDISVGQSMKARWTYAFINAILGLFSLGTSSDPNEMDTYLMEKRLKKLLKENFNYQDSDLQLQVMASTRKQENRAVRIAFNVVAIILSALLFYGASCINDSIPQNHISGGEILSNEYQDSIENFTIQRDYEQYEGKAVLTYTPTNHVILVKAYIDFVERKDGYVIVNYSDDEFTNNYNLISPDGELVFKDKTFNYLTFDIERLVTPDSYGDILYDYKGNLVEGGKGFIPRHRNTIGFVIYLIALFISISIIFFANRKASKYIKRNNEQDVE